MLQAIDRTLVGALVALAILPSMGGCGSSSTPGLQGVDPGTDQDDPGGAEADQLQGRDEGGDFQDLLDSLDGIVDTLVDSAPGDALPDDQVHDLVLDVPGDADSCTRICADHDCGDDGCGGTCGTCTDGKVCMTGLCTCAPQDHKACCDKAVCWFDSCGAQGDAVADCPFGCKDGACEACMPQCESKECGEDGCGKDCGTCAVGKCDGLEWTPAEFCDAGTCMTGQVENCDDANPCTVDTCDAKAGCSRTDAGDGFVCVAGSCDGQVWTLPMTCISGQCIGGGGTEGCGDVNDCTDDTCSAALGCVYTQNTQTCDDHDPCTLVDACQGGTCQGTGTLDCNDQNPCTADTCIAGEGCTYSSINEGLPCINGACTGLSWTRPALCVGGACTPGGVTSCNDGKSCTTDTCSPTKGCTNLLQAGKCLIGDACYETNQTDPSDVCKVCTPSATQTAWSTKSCDDWITCTLDSCNPTAGCSNVVSDGFCLIDGVCYSDGQWISGNSCQVCVSSNGKTSWTSQPDGVQCGASSCLGQVFTAPKTCLNSYCQGGGAHQTCDDGKSCTFNACTTGGCQYTIQNGSCLIGGTCYANGFTNPANSCQECASSTKQTAWTTKANGTTCIQGSCSGLTWSKPITCSAGNCTGGGGTQMCGDGVTCTTDACLPSGCTNNLVSGRCLIDGVCYSTGQMNPNNPCQLCQPSISTSAWTNAADGGQCAAASCSGLTLLWPKTCAAGQCVGGTKSCDDGLACTTDSCSPTTGCANVLVAGKCRIDGACYSDGQGDPQNACHVCSVTDSTSSWTSLDVGAICQSGTCAGLTWTQPKTCSSTRWCVIGGGVSSCDDGIACTTDTCNPTNGCSNVPQTRTCVIGGVCYSRGDENPTNMCQVCADTLSTSSWSNFTGGQCEAGFCSFQAYTTPKTCSAGQCSSGGTTSACVSTSCSVASCNDATGCSQAVQDGYCLIGGTCYGSGQENPASVCQVCTPSTSTKAWSVKSGYCLIGGTCYATGTTGTTYSCTHCDPKESVSLWSVKPANCLILMNNVPTCFNEGDWNPTTKCLGCIHATSPTTWTPQNEGAACLPPVPSATCHDGVCY